MATSREALAGQVLTAFAWWARTIRRASSAPFTAHELSASQKDALFVLAHSRQHVTPGSLAASLNLTAGAVTQLLEPLIARGLIATQPHPHDGRSRILSLSATAADHVREFEAAVTTDLLSHFDNLSTEELAQLARLLSLTTESHS